MYLRFPTCYGLYIDSKTVTIVKDVNVAIGSLPHIVTLGGGGENS